jgi:MFS transporter, Spinster family, sphingosine-1-phosphate transporter
MGKRRQNVIILLLLTAAYTVGFLDRQVLNLLVQPIKQSFGLSDVQVSLLQGLGFSCGYLLLSPVFGKWVDSGSRRTIMATATGTWSLFTALAGCARGFYGLLAARVGLGGAEAGIAPACWSLISDLFEERHWPFAFSIFFLAPYVGGGLALLLGGLIVEAAAGWDFSGWPALAAAAPWQWVFFAVSIPGLVVAGLLLLIREPSRRSRREENAQPPKWTEVFRVLWRDRGFFANFYIGMACAIIPLYAFPAWMPGFLMRHFATSIHQVGSAWGTITLIAGSMGMLSGPVIGASMRKRGIAMTELRLPIACALGLAASCIALHFCTRLNAALAAAGCAIFINSAPLALAATALQRASAPRMRGTTAALYSIVVMISGLAAAPTLVALLTDYVFRDEGRVGDSLEWVCGMSALTGAVLLWRATRHYVRLESAASGSA